MILGIRRELSAGNGRSDLLDAVFGFFQLCVVARGRDGRIVFEVVKDQAVGPLAQGFLGRDCIERKLQALVGVVLRLRLAGLVIDDGNCVGAGAIDAIDAPS